MTATLILESLAREFKTNLEYVQAAIDMIDAGLTEPFIGRYRRPQVGGLSESFIRRLDKRRKDLEELERRKGTILRLLEKEEGATESVKDQIKACTDRFEVEDLFLPHRRPEPEVQLALDRGLGQLADRLTTSLPKDQRQARDAAGAENTAEVPNSTETVEGQVAETAVSPEASTPEVAPAVVEEAVAVIEPIAEPSATAEAPAEAEAPAPAVAPATEGAPAQADAVATPEASAGADAAPESKKAEDGAESSAESLPPEKSEEASAQEMLTPELARICGEFVSPDRGVHNETEALAGAMRILSDRLGRNPRLRGTLRRMLRKHGILSVRPLVNEKKAGRHKGLLKLSQPMRQIQGNRLLAIRQAQKERILATRISMDPALAMQRVREAMGKHFDPAVHGALNEVCLRALTRRLLPMIEEDVRLELKERADAEALRFLSQHLRQLFLTPVLPRRVTVAGVDVNAKGDWTFVALDGEGKPVGTEEIKIETGAKDAEALGAELVTALGPFELDCIAISSGKSSRNAVIRMRSAIKAAGLNLVVFIATEAGLSSYANSEQARTELPELSISQRMAVSLARRLQDPMFELLKVDPRHLSLGSEQALVSKANVRRCFAETVESCVAHVGCEVNTAPAHFLAALPGLDKEAAAKIVERRALSPIMSRAELRDEGILTEAQWASAAGFLRIYQSSDPLDRSNLHPEQYMVARKLIESVGGSVEDALGSAGSTRGLKREDFDVDLDTWRDLMRELAHPGRDPRHRLFPPALLDPETDPALLVKNKVVEGIVSNVTSFGAFVDVGLKQDAIIHISELSNHYVRDARELVSVGQVVRAKILESSGQRLTLTLKGVPREVREPRAHRGGGGSRGRRGGGGSSSSGGGSRGRGRGGRERDEGPKVNPNLRAAQSRRDGLAGARNHGASRRGGGGRRGAGGRGREEGGERVNLREVNKAATKTANNPFAAFFKDDDGPN
ncbi:MAG: hypothetical protein ACI8X5_002804 [Planctomycetota bacterium]